MTDELFNSRKEKLALLNGELEVLLRKRRSLHKQLQNLFPKVESVKGKIWRLQHLLNGLCRECGRNRITRSQDGTGRRITLCIDCRDKDYARKFGQKKTVKRAPSEFDTARANRYGMARPRTAAGAR